MTAGWIVFTVGKGVLIIWAVWVIRRAVRWELRQRAFQARYRERMARRNEGRIWERCREAEYKHALELRDARFARGDAQLLADVGLTLVKDAAVEVALQAVTAPAGVTS